MNAQHSSSKWGSLARIMSLGVILALAFATTAYAGAPGQFLLPANAGWADSGVALGAGQLITITAYGRAITARINIFGPGSQSGPDGQSQICPNFDGAPPCAMDFAPYGALVGKIGPDGTPFLIGSNDTFTPAVSGELYLAVNDLLPYYSDNYGNYMIFFSN